MEHLCTAVFTFLEGAKPFFQYGKTLQDALPFLVQALGGIVPLDALAIARTEGKKGACEPTVAGRLMESSAGSTTP